MNGKSLKIGLGILVGLSLLLLVVCFFSPEVAEWTVTAFARIAESLGNFFVNFLPNVGAFFLSLTSLILDNWWKIILIFFALVAGVFIIFH